MVAFLTTEGGGAFNLPQKYSSYWRLPFPAVHHHCCQRGLEDIECHCPHAGRCLTLFKFGQLTVPIYLLRCNDLHLCPAIIHNAETVFWLAIVPALCSA